MHSILSYEGVQSILHQEGDVTALQAGLESVLIISEELEHEKAGNVTHVEIVYTLNGVYEQFEHVFHFYTSDYTNQGRKSWDEFIELISKVEENEGSLLYFIKRNGSVMREFVDFCIGVEYGISAAA